MCHSNWSHQQRLVRPRPTSSSSPASNEAMTLLPFSALHFLFHSSLLSLPLALPNSIPHSIHLVSNLSRILTSPSDSETLRSEEFVQSRLRRHFSKGGVVKFEGRGWVEPWFWRSNQNQIGVELNWKGFALYSCCDGIGIGMEMELEPIFAWFCHRFFWHRLVTMI